MSDLISRGDAIESFCEFGTSSERQGKTLITMVDAKYAFIKTLESLPSAEVEWIPCSERLPKENAKYLVQMSCGIMRVLRWANILEKVDDYDFYNEKHGGWYELDNEWGYCEMHGIVAWMPLPKPYKGGAE